MPTTATPAETANQDETSEEQGQQSTSETEGQDEQEQENQEEQEQGTEGEKPDEKPKPDPRLKTLRADLNKKATELVTTSQERDALKTEVEKLRPVQETLDAVQSRYDRLEAFLTQAGGPLARALDSRTFTQALFESDKDIADIVKEWHRANPTATTTALSSAAGGDRQGKLSPNELLRIAAGKG